MRLNEDTVARIKACRGVYSMGDCARHFGVSKSTVHSIWQGRSHQRIAAAPEPPSVRSTRVHPSIIEEDGRLLLERGMSTAEAAVALGVSPSTLKRYVQPMVVVIK